MTVKELEQESLSRAKGNMSTSNYRSIVSGFIDKGINPDDIKPRENIFTFKAWRALGRFVRKGQHGVKILTWIPVDATDDDKNKKKRSMRPKSATVFHVSQTDSLT